MESQTFIILFWIVSMWIIMAVGWFLYGRDATHGAVVKWVRILGKLDH